jgi:hypothetical protein
VAKAFLSSSGIPVSVLWDVILPWNHLDFQINMVGTSFPSNVLNEFNSTGFGKNVQFVQYMNLASLDKQEDQVEFFNHYTHAFSDAIPILSDVASKEHLDA